MLPPMMSLKPPTLPSLLPLAASALAPTSPPAAKDNALLVLCQHILHGRYLAAAVVYDFNHMSACTLV